MFLINFWLVLVFLVVFLSLKEAKNEGKLCATLGNELLSQSRGSEKEIHHEAILHGDAKSSHAM